MASRVTADTARDIVAPARLRSELTQTAEAITVNDESGEYSAHEHAASLTLMGAIPMWWTRTVSAVVGAFLVIAIAAMGRAQNPGSGSSSPSQSTTSARVETAALELAAPERFNVPSVLEPVRRITVVAPTDGILRSLPLAIGATVRDGQEIADLDRAEAKSKVKIAEASVKEMDAEVKAASTRDTSAAAIAAARLDAAKARAEIANLELDRCSLRAPFGGRLLSLTVSPGQYVAKGTTVGELADVSSLRVLVPVDRTAVKAGASLEVVIEGKAASGRVQTVLPLPESFSALRELATPWAGALISFDNPGGTLEPGQRVRGPWMPDAPIATVASRAVRQGASGKGSVVQVLRNDYVSNVPVRVLGPTGPERIQVSGPFRENDLVIVESSVPLAAGTFLRFDTEGSGRPVEGLNPRPDETGVVANITPPSGAVGRIAPIGSPGTTTGSKSKTSPKSSGVAPATKPAGKNTVPF
jgi:RND family efflux transporter MFP subunit